MLGLKTASFRLNSAKFRLKLANSRLALANSRLKLAHTPVLFPCSMLRDSEQRSSIVGRKLLIVSKEVASQIERVWGWRRKMGVKGEKGREGKGQRGKKDGE